MAFRHGVYKSEVPTSLISPVQGEAGLPVVIGTSPVFLGDMANVNKPVLCYSYSEAVKALGFIHKDWDKWTLSEFMYSQFALFGQSPCVLINVFDPNKHKTDIEDEVITIPSNKELNLGENVIISKGFTFKTNPSAPEVITPAHTSAYNGQGNAVITFSAVGLPETLKVSYTKADDDTVEDEVVSTDGTTVNLGLNVFISKSISFKTTGDVDVSTQFTAEYDTDGNAIITFSSDTGETSLKATYTKADTSTIETVSDEVHSITGSTITLGDDVLIARGFTFKTNPDDPEVLNLHYTADYNDDAEAIITLEDLDLPSTVRLSYTVANPDAVTSADIVGGVNATTGAVKGLELVSKVFPMFGLIPGIICVPKWSEQSTVAAVMAAKCENINGLFTCISVVDVPSDSDSGARVYSSVTAWKNSNNYTNKRQIVCWPKVKLGDDVFHMSTQLVGLMNKTDSNYDDVPYKSPSNENFQMDGCINAEGDEITLGLEEANYLNSNGVVTALNFIGGWKAWGNWTGIYPSNTDPKDCQIPIRRMFDFIGNTFITTFWQKVDAPLTPRLIRTIVNSFNVYLNGLTAREQILGGRIEFLEDENPTTDLMAGIVKFHIFMTPPPAAAVIEGILEYDTDYFSTLVSALG